jgi:hypothetical protein
VVNGVRGDIHSVREENGDVCDVVLRDLQGRLLTVSELTHTILLGETGKSVARTAFPLQQADACTIHKSQGMNIAAPYAGDISTISAFPSKYTQRALATVVVSRGTAAEYLNLVYRIGDRLATPAECERKFRSLFKWEETDPDVLAYHHVMSNNVLKSAE